MTPSASSPDGPADALTDPAPLSDPTLLGPQMLGQMADILAWPLLVLHADGTLVHANLAARLLLRSGHPLQLTADCHVRSTQSGRQGELSSALATAASQRQRCVLHWPAPLTGADSRPGAVPSGLHNTAVSLTVAPLTRRGDAHDGVAGGQVGAAADAAPAPVIVAITSAGSQTADLSAFASEHALSEAETRVLKRMAVAESSPRAAAALGVAQATVRSQTASLRRKTGHASMADLVRTLARLPPTLPAGEPLQ